MSTHYKNKINTNNKNQVFRLHTSVGKKNPIFNPIPVPPVPYPYIPIPIPIL